ncbi:Prostaglandin reductase 1, partial [Pseudolycoriella hygida]
MVVAKKYIYVERFVGEPKLSDFKLVEEELPPLKENEVLAEALFLSVDPYMRAYVDRLQIGQVMIGGQVAKVLDSKHPNYKVGDNIFGQFGWRTHTVFNPSSDVFLLPPYVLPSFGDLPLSLGIGALGMPGNTAYFGFLEICEPKAGETVVVSGAAGAVGSLVGQIAKIKGCTVIGIAGSDDKCNWLKTELGFDHVINYKTEDIAKALRIAAPEGVDCYFDNVGGEMSSIVLQQMRLFGRISCCGSISCYNFDANERPKVPLVQPSMVFSQLKMEGFIVNRWNNRWMEGIRQMLKWIKEGQLKYNETTTDGFENIPTAFIEMLQGKNTGKAVIKRTHSAHSTVDFWLANNVLTTQNSIKGSISCSGYGKYCATGKRIGKGNEQSDLNSGKTKFNSLYCFIFRLLKKHVLNGSNKANYCPIFRLEFQCHHSCRVYQSPAKLCTAKLGSFAINSFRNNLANSRHRLITVDPYSIQNSFSYRKVVLKGKCIRYLKCHGSDCQFKYRVAVARTSSSYEQNKIVEAAHNY